MHMHLKGVHRVKKTLADGRVETYLYAWRGGPRLVSKPGSPEIVAEYAGLVAARKRPRTEDVGALVAE